MNSITDLLNSKNEYYDGQGIQGFVQGTVVGNSDEQYKGMVRVEFTAWETGKNICQWVRLMAPYAGAAYGEYWVPEINDIVLVGFIGGSLKRPFLLGSLYPADAGVIEKSFDQNNLKKRILTKGGTDILIEEKAGEQSITVSTPKGSSIRIEDENESCTIADKAQKNMVKLDYKNGEISIVADKKITLKTGKASISLEGSSEKADIQVNDININAKKNINLEGGTSLQLKGVQVSLEGKANMKIKGGAITEISGSLVKIN